MLEGNLQYIGYDDIGEDFEPEVTYWDFNNTERYGVYSAWNDTNGYARRKYGNDYTQIKEFSRYGATLDMYDVKK